MRLARNKLSITDTSIFCLLVLKLSIGKGIHQSMGPGRRTAIWVGFMGFILGAMVSYTVLKSWHRRRTAVVPENAFGAASAGGMIFSEHIAFSLVTLSLLVTPLGSAVLAMLRGKNHLCNGGHEKDMISRLPDDILVSIITHIPTKSAMRTSVLSKRWRNLHKSMSKIELHCRDLLRRYTPGPHDSHSDEIIYRLERFFRLYSGSKISSFTLQCCFTKSYTDRFEQCIHYLAKLGIEELFLYFSCCRRPSDPSFSCHLLSEMPSLKFFMLCSSSLQPSLKSPSMKSLSNSLQTIILMFVTVLPGSLECILSSCLRLHSVEIFSCHCPSKLCFRGPNLQLKTLIIEHCNGVEEIEFYASNLITFEFQNFDMINFKFDHVPQLQTVYLSLESKNLLSHALRKLAKDLPHLKSLTFHTKGGFDQESRGLMCIRNEMFNNLRRLELGVYCTPKTNLFALIPFLQSCPRLQEFHFDARNVQYDVAKPRKPAMLHLELKKVEMSGFDGTENEIDFALYILRSAFSLEQMLISLHPRYYAGHGRWMTLGGTPWTEETRKMIEQRLQGQALSNSAQVIIV